MRQKLILQSKWFSAENPQNPKAASAILTFSGDVEHGETVEIGDEVYEFYIVAEEDLGEYEGDNIPVELEEATEEQGDADKDDAAEELVKVVNANSKLVSAALNKAEHKVIFSARQVGKEGNDIEISEDCANASFGEAIKLAGGQFGTPCSLPNAIVFDEDYYYWCVKAGGSRSVQWKRFKLSDY